MAAAASVPDSVSFCGSTNMRRADHLPQLLIPLPCMGKPTAASRVLPGSSPARYEASRGSPCYKANAEPDSEASNTAAADHYSCSSAPPHRATHSKDPHE